MRSGDSTQRVLHRRLNTTLEVYRTTFRRGFQSILSHREAEGLAKESKNVKHSKSGEECRRHTCCDERKARGLKGFWQHTAVEQQDQHPRGTADTYHGNGCRRRSSAGRGGRGHRHRRFAAAAAPATQLFGVAPTD